MPEQDKPFDGNETVDLCIECIKRKNRLEKKGHKTDNFNYGLIIDGVCDRCNHRPTK